MSQILKNVIIIGANGNLGPSILKALDDASNLTVSVLSRKGSKSTYASHIKVHEVEGSYPEDQLLAAFSGQDAVVLTISPNDVGQIKVLIDVAIKAGVKRFIPSEFGSDTANPEVVQKVPIFAGKQEIAKYLQSKETSSFSWTGIINGAFFDWGLQQNFFGIDLKNHNATIYDGGNVPTPLTFLSTVGAAVVATLEKPSETANKFLYIADYVASQNEMLAAAEKATGKKWEVTQASSKELYQESIGKITKGDFSGIIGLLQSAIFSGEDCFDYKTNKGLDNEKLGLAKPEPLDAAIEKIIKG